MSRPDAGHPPWRRRTAGASCLIAPAMSRGPGHGQTWRGIFTGSGPSRPVSRDLVAPGSRPAETHFGVWLTATPAAPAPSGDGDRTDLGQSAAVYGELPDLTDLVSFTYRVWPSVLRRAST